MHIESNYNFKNNKFLITGGAGFIGSNLADFLLSKGAEVIIYDNLSRKMVENNLKWLKANPSGKLKIIVDDVRNAKGLNKAIKNVGTVFHLAAQVAVTDSVNNPIEDFEINALGALNVLEAVRKYNPQATVAFSSTNKVYGAMESLKYGKTKQRYTFSEKKFKNGISESFPLDFHSPYGCSKGAADQYFHDYSRIYGLNTVVFRQSCIYGNRQFGNEDQGWVMHFLKKFLQGKEINIYGDGKQVRDVLYIDDLISAYMAAIGQIDKIKGSIFNIGGGSKNTISLIELIEIFQKKFNNPARYSFSDWRPGDQKIFYANIEKAYKDIAWEPKINIIDGIDKLHEWVLQII